MHVRARANAYVRAAHKRRSITGHRGQFSQRGDVQVLDRLQRELLARDRHVLGDGIDILRRDQVHSAAENVDHVGVDVHGASDEVSVAVHVHLRISASLQLRVRGGESR